jgi:hypothetical protein
LRKREERKKKKKGMVIGDKPVNLYICTRCFFMENMPRHIENNLEKIILAF